MRAALGTVLATSVLALAGCGDDGDERLSREEFLTRADEICAEYDRRLTNLDDPASVRDVAEVARQAFPIAQQGVARLRELKPPEELERDVAAWLERNDANVASIHRLEEAATSGNPRRVQEVASEAAENERQADALAKKIGLKDCAES